MDEIADLLARAAHYRALATRVTDEQTREGLLELAEKYETLAQEQQGEATRRAPGRASRRRGGRRRARRLVSCRHPGPCSARTTSGCRRHAGPAGARRIRRWRPPTSRRRGDDPRRRLFFVVPIAGPAKAATALLVKRFREGSSRCRRLRPNKLAS